ncbi:hypothetical protein DL98DRAFT_285787 [Cadophora sp. DSE1049]|nr:hypothetical protein DL98DRAFT_285787 [Cadophora sp. DSE1049]
MAPSIDIASSTAFAASMAPTMPVLPLVVQPQAPTMPPLIPGDRTEVSIVTLGRLSWDKGPVVLRRVKAAGIPVQNKYIADFLTGVRILRKLNIVWNARSADEGLPFVSLTEQEMIDLRFLNEDGDYHNDREDAAWIEFLNTRPDWSEDIVLLRGIDGGSISPGSWLYLERLYPRLRFTIAITVAEDFVNHRVPGIGGNNWFFATNPYDTRLYASFPLNHLSDHLSGRRPDAMMRWLLSEWHQGALLRQQISMAYQSGDERRIGDAQRRFKTLRTTGRNEVPMVRD